MITTHIECRYGAVKVQLSGEPMAQFYCHCDDCQAVHGAAYVPIAMYPSDEVKVTQGNPSNWKLKLTPRTTCTECGTRIFSEVPGFGVRGVNAYPLPKGLLRPEFHLQCQFALLTVRDDLPHYKALPARFGGSDACVAW